MGLGLPTEGVAPPRSIPRHIRRLRELGVASEDLEFHPHNDTHLVVANCLAAIQAGCSVINGTLLGTGERTGNAPLEAIVLHEIGMGLIEEPLPDFHALNDLADLYAELGRPLAPTYPLYGRDAHRTRAGIHADGLNKFWWMYAPFDVPTPARPPAGGEPHARLRPRGPRSSSSASTPAETYRRTTRASPRSTQALMEQFDAGRQTAVEWEEVASIGGF